MNGPSTSTPAGNKPPKALRSITLVMMIGGPLSYLSIAWLINSNGFEARAGNDLLFYLLLVIALVSPAIAPAIERLAVQKYRDGRSREASAAQLFQSVSIIRMAMVETAYIYGFVVFMLTGDLMKMLYFYPIGAGWSLVHWPRQSRFEQLQENLNRP